MPIKTVCLVLLLSAEVFIKKTLSNSAYYSWKCI